jgi:hypothetical protein
LQRFAREQEFQSAEMIYGLPDVKAAPVFRRLGAAIEFTSGNYARVLRSGSYAIKLFPKVPAALVRLVCWFVDRARIALVFVLCAAYGVSTEWRREFPESLDTLWTRTAFQPDLATGERDREFLKWRFSSSRDECQVLTVAQRKTPVAYFVCRREGKRVAGAGSPGGAARSRGHAVVGSLPGRMGTRDEDRAQSCSGDSGASRVHWRAQVSNCAINARVFSCSRPRWARVACLPVGG